MSSNLLLFSCVYSHSSLTFAYRKRSVSTISATEEVRKGNTTSRSRQAQIAAKRRPITHSSQASSLPLKLDVVCAAYFTHADLSKLCRGNKAISQLPVER